MRYAAIYFAFIILIATGIFATNNFITDWSQKKRNFTNEILFTLERGQSLAALAKDLEQKKIIKPAWFFELWVKFKSDYSRFQAGSYRVLGELSVIDISTMLINGSSYEPTVFSLMVPEGFTIKQIAERVGESGLVSKQELFNKARDYRLLNELNISGDSLEGYLYPAFYTFTTIPTAEEILKKMVKTFHERLPTDYVTRAESMGLSLQQAVTFAALIEMETSHDFERPKIAEVIWNRLKARMALGIDAAIIYGIPDFDGDLKFKDLQDRSNPYNTRIHIGLPPGPICSPSIKSLLAVLEPTSNGYYYYVVDVPTKQHHFSRDLKEHNQRVKKMLADFNAQQVAQ